MTSRIQEASVVVAATSRKSPSSFHTQYRGAPVAGIYAHSQQKRSISPVYSVRQGTSGTTSNTTGTNHFQVQKMLVYLCEKYLNMLESMKVIRKIIQVISNF